MKIVQAPDQVLTKKAEPVKKIDKTIHHLLREMETTLNNAVDPEGVGLAAPQVGKSLQIFIIRNEPNAPLLTFINPQIESFIDREKKPDPEEKKKGVQLEGCLSLQSVWGVVDRHSGLVLSYLDEQGKQHKQTYNGFLATIIQHEFDHLQGILFPKRVLEQKNPLYHSMKNKEGEIEFEEIEL